MLTSGVFFELVVLKELGYIEIYIYYKDPSVGMDILVDDKYALDIIDLCRVHLGVEIYIQHLLFQPDYYEGPIDDVEDVNHKDIINLEEEYLIVKLYEQSS